MQRHLEGLAPVDDLHVLSLDTTLFERMPGLPRACWLPVAGANCDAVSDYALAHGCAGMARTYALLRRRRIAQHRALGQHVAVGFSSHRNVLYRETGRGVD